MSTVPSLNLKPNPHGGIERERQREREREREESTLQKKKCCANSGKENQTGH
jgi:hypothetical protein